MFILAHNGVSNCGHSRAGWTEGCNKPEGFYRGLFRLDAGYVPERYPYGPYLETFQVFIRALIIEAPPLMAIRVKKKAPALC